ncbi:peptide deformylase [Nocardia sp. NPDC051570]|uniref:peptide deformylase n=1 Tax=Nocardia sp. NPDC051570 TaxID=3364324 RepID=UPI0037A5E73B
MLVQRNLSQPHTIQTDREDTLAGAKQNQPLGGGRLESRGISPSQVMADLGILQEGDPLLCQVARPFDLPTEAGDACRVVAGLNSAAERVVQAHIFSKGMGLAAPQIGIDRAAVIVRTSRGDRITLLNPRIVEASATEDEQYEGCLSFFDVRGKVPRPLTIGVEYADLDGRKHITVFERGTARLVAHEVDHLEGHLYRDRMRPGIEPISVEEYRGTGKSWTYGPTSSGS